MGKVDPMLALARQQLLASAARRALDGCLPSLTSVDAALPPTPARKTNPNPSRATGASLRTAPVSGARSAAQLAPRRSMARDAALPSLTPVDRALPNSPARKTNPNAPPAAPMLAAALPPHQLAAARLLAHGRRTRDVAAELGVSRQALWQWRQHPAFVAELRRLHELLAREGRR
jgi:Helix-turn-helix of insertion element transposase